MAVLEIVSINGDDEPVGRPVDWKGEGDPPQIAVHEERPQHGRRRGGPPGGALGVGDRVLVRLHGTRGRYHASVIKKLSPAPRTVIGIYDGKNRIRSTERSGIADYWVHDADTMGAQKNELVEAQILQRRRLERPRAKVVERLGGPGDKRSFSLIAIHNNDIPHVFPREVLAEAAAAGPVSADGRVDLRDVPLVTIDGADARDFDDAVWAEPAEVDGHPGWHLIVAIADVAWYVRPGSALDEEALKRGNSTYFPDRVVPMLPEAFSNGWCSLRPNEDRACMAAHIWIDNGGNILRHRFERAIMRSVQRLTYEQVQHARDHGTPGLAPIIAPLYGAYDALIGARQKRETIDLDVPERIIRLDASGRVIDVVPRARLDSHRLIEEFMIAANVAAAETLERLKQPCMYRVHDAPPEGKLLEFAEFVSENGLKFSKGQVITPALFNRVLAQARDKGIEEVVSQVVLRTQAQAEYSTANIGHFGLALRRYCHFTSPIRRYADLLVHRALIAGLKLGEGGLPPGNRDLAPLGPLITACERRSVAAEREAADRFVASYYDGREGELVSGRIAGATRAGLFVRLDDTQADGFVPRRTLAVRPSRRGGPARRSGRGRREEPQIGDSVRCRIVEAEGERGSLILEIVES